MRDARELGGAWRRFQRHRTAAPSPELAGYIEHYWTVHWDYAEPYRQLITALPRVHLTISSQVGATVRGVARGHRCQTLTGRGRVFGVAFRPGAFRPILGAPVSGLTDRVVDAVAVFGAEPPVCPEVAAIEEFLHPRLPEPGPAGRAAVEAVALIAARPDLTRVDQLATELGSPVRTLQRLFAEHVGVSPKWVLRRYRVHEVARRLEAGAEIDWPVLAADLGYADQAHFVRDFTRLMGEPPTRFAARYPDRSERFPAR
ncbi:DUF6597 domain-containing transcriptional factor [Nocardia jiangsuensis]|uniref:DUF6597 domain-containing transcriptional factor n=1 Tax=Nocardia jiangsuensis TaxID=1691563 RepID=A0ABV8DZ13_9NOCA